MKKLLSLAAVFVALPCVLAAKQGMIAAGLEAAFDAAGSDVFVKLALWVVLFTGLYLGAKKAFPDDTKIPAIISVIISFIAIRFMPIVWFGAFKTYLLVVAILLLPYFIMSLVFAPGWARRIFYVLSVLGLWYLVSSYSFLYSSPRLRGNEFIDYLRYVFSSEWIFGIPFHLVIIVVIVVLLLILGIAKWATGRTGGAPSGPSGPGLLSRFGGWLGRRADRRHDLKMIREQQKGPKGPGFLSGAGQWLANRPQKQVIKQKGPGFLSGAGQWLANRPARPPRQPGPKRKLWPFGRKKALAQGPAKGSVLHPGYMGRWRQATQGPLKKIRPISPQPAKPGLGSRINQGLMKKRSFWPWGRKPKIKMPPKPKGYKLPKAGPPKGYVPFVKKPKPLKKLEGWAQRKGLVLGSSAPKPRMPLPPFKKRGLWPFRKKKKLPPW